MKIYIAANYAYDRLPAQDLARILAAEGHTITQDWWSQSGQGLEAAAINDLAGIDAADAIVMLMDRPREFRGVWVEMGCALAGGKQVIQIGPYGAACVFSAHPLVRRVDTVDEVIALLGQPTETA
jgi:nucleoside 2-deoxyribosyltransferase